ncbi:hypothetical protein EIP86_009226 [Pleurotus ostreatoroseus]|nr:hypothetical protein EIP86_009226 [Pleurotus ostreatoroseus]
MKQITTPLTRLLGFGGANGVRRELTTVKGILESRGTPHAFHLPVGVGYMGWKLDEAGPEATAMLDAALESNVQAIWLALGKDFKPYVNHIRQHDATTGHRTLIFIVVNSVAEALVAANELKADVIVAQGIESGGHGAGDALPVFPLVSNILSALPKDGPPVLPAGGITTGAQVAAFLALGASGVVMGTRFLLTPDSSLSASQRQALLNADATQTVRSTAFDQARNTLGWPQGVDGRALRNKITHDVEQGIDMRTIQERVAEGTKQGAPEYSIIFAGTGVGEIHEVKDVKDVLKDIHSDTNQRIHALTHLIHECHQA